MTWDWYFHYILNTTDTNESLYGRNNIYYWLEYMGSTWNELSEQYTRIARSYGTPTLNIIFANIADIIYNHIIICSIDIKKLIKLLLPIISPTFTNILLEFTELFDKFYHFIRYYQYENIIENDGSLFQGVIYGTQQRDSANYLIAEISKFYTYIIKLEQGLYYDIRSGENTTGFEESIGDMFSVDFYKIIRDWCNTTENGPWPMVNNKYNTDGINIIPLETITQNMIPLETITQNMIRQVTKYFKEQQYLNTSGLEDYVNENNAMI